MANTNVSLSKENFDKVLVIAKKEGKTRSGWLNGLLKKIDIDTEGTKVILTIPDQTIGSKESLQEWLKSRTDFIVRHFHP